MKLCVDNITGTKYISAGNFGEEVGCFRKFPAEKYLRKRFL